MYSKAEVSIFEQRLSIRLQITKVHFLLLKLPIRFAERDLDFHREGEGCSIPVAANQNRVQSAPFFLCAHSRATCGI